MIQESKKKHAKDKDHKKLIAGDIKVFQQFIKHTNKSAITTGLIDDYHSIESQPMNKKV